MLKLFHLLLLAAVRDRGGFGCFLRPPACFIRRAALNGDPSRASQSRDPPKKQIGANCVSSLTPATLARSHHLAPYNRLQLRKHSSSDRLPPSESFRMQRSLLVALGLLHSAASFQPTSRAVTRTAPLQAGFATTTRKKKVKKSKGSKSKDASGLTTDKGWTPLTELTERVELGAAKAVGRSA